jgi:hypothetical protein
LLGSTDIPKVEVDPPPDVPYDVTEKPDKRVITLGFNLLLYETTPLYYRQDKEQQHTPKVVAVS